jgi:RimJ/RimL family protein N-acetyltransferase
MIQGKKVELRAIEEIDELRYKEWINDPATNQWRGLYHPHSSEDASAWITLQKASRPDQLTLSLVTDTAHVGFIGLRGICPRSRRAELWIYIGEKSAWNKGVGQDAIRTLCQYAFDEMNLFRIWMECDPEFEAAVRCYEKVGFVREGTLRKAYYRRGKYRDTCMMGLLRTDWEPQA